MKKLKVIFTALNGTLLPVIVLYNIFKIKPYDMVLFLILTVFCGLIFIGGILTTLLYQKLK